MRCSSQILLVVAAFWLAAAAGCMSKEPIPGYTSGPRSQSPGSAGPAVSEPRSPASLPPAPRGTFKPYTILGQTYYPLATGEGFSEEGVASWYGRDFHGKKTANGERYDMHAMTAAHRLLPMNTRVLVTSLENGRSVEVRINDRGPFAKNRIIDLSFAAAGKLGMVEKGTMRVRIVTIGGVPGATVQKTASGATRMELPGPFYVQVGAFVEQKNAVLLAGEMRKLGYDETRLEEAVIEGRRFWRVQAGVFPDMGRAETALSRLDRSYPGAFILAGSR